MTLTVSSICYWLNIGISNCASYVMADEAAAEGQQYVAAATCCVKRSYASHSTAIAVDILGIAHFEVHCPWGKQLRSIALLIVKMMQCR